eukprot:COSAG01_NODE_2744_length_7150_cov_5.435116_4_plen_86_part_00
MHNIMGNSAQGLGYGCQMVDLVSTWRRAWSRTAGTTDPQAPFGVVTLAAGGGEGGADMGTPAVSMLGCGPFRLRFTCAAPILTTK